MLGLMLVKQFAQSIHIECVVFVYHLLAWIFNFGQWQRLPDCQKRQEKRKGKC